MQPPKHESAPKKTWAQIAAEKRPNIQDVSKATQEGLRKCLAMLDINNPEPKPTALYFRNLKRARLGHVRKALRQMFNHPWAVLGLSFIGKSVIEIVCHEGLVDQIVAKLRLIGATHIKNMNIFGDNMKKLSTKDTRARTTTNLERAHQRFERLTATCTNAAAKSWYAKQAHEAENRLAEIYQPAHDVETSVSDDSEDNSDDVAENSQRVVDEVPSDEMDVEPNARQVKAASSVQVPQNMDTEKPAEETTDQAQDAPPQL